MIEEIMWHLRNFLGLNSFKFMLNVLLDSWSKTSIYDRKYIKKQFELYTLTVARKDFKKLMDLATSKNVDLRTIIDAKNDNKLDRYGITNDM